MSARSPREVAGKMIHGAVAGATALAAEATEYATRGAHARIESHTRPNLKLVSPLRQVKASRGTFALIVGAMLIGGLGAMLVINTQLAQGSFAVSSLKQELGTLTEQAAVLNEEVSAAAAPEALASKARALGMVASRTPVFLSIPDGKVLGRPQPAPGTPVKVLANTGADEAITSADLGLPPVPGPNYDPARADAEAAARANAGTAGEDSLWREVPVQVGSLGSSDADLVAVPVR
ncbi:MAG TPA: hypothetical protein DDY88_02925 [Actinobacteria bacterium]|nr:hypothetical protein [Actinomycetota bacterium]